MSVAGLTGDVRDRCKRLGLSSKAALLEVARQFDEAAMFEHLDKIESGDLKPTQVRKPPKVNAASTNGSATSARAANSFSYASKDGETRISISFADKAGYDKRRVLDALRQAVEDITNGVFPV